MLSQSLPHTQFYSLIFTKNPLCDISLQKCKILGVFLESAMRFPWKGTHCPLIPANSQNLRITHHCKTELFSVLQVRGKGGSNSVFFFPLVPQVI
ncbi:hypothetical protein Nmel_018721 [Mimus melanotis]